MRAKTIKDYMYDALVQRLMKLFQQYADQKLTEKDVKQAVEEALINTKFI